LLVWLFFPSTRFSLATWSAFSSRNPRSDVIQSQPRRTSSKRTGSGNPIREIRLREQRAKCLAKTSCVLSDLRFLQRKLRNSNQSRSQFLQLERQSSVYASEEGPGNGKDTVVDSIN
jgi:hypothetical protein